MDTISVLCPTRLRYDRLKASLDSLEQTANGYYEILLAIDPDDPSDYEGLDVDQVLRFDKRYGYGRLHEYFNRLASVARGDWLMLWNDDCVMSTQHWDQLIGGEPQTHVLAPHTHHDPLIVLPVIPRAWAVACGHYAEILHCDTWWQDLGHKLGCVKWIDVEIDHQRFDKPGHETEPDQVYKQRDFRLHEFYGTPLQASHNRDVQVVRDLIAAA